jgi:hypothetical protein
LPLLKPAHGNRLSQVATHPLILISARPKWVPDSNLGLRYRCATK